MGDTVARVVKTSILDNPAAMEKKINDLVQVKYSGPDWVRMGPNFVRNTASGEVINLNQEAVSVLQSEGPREDAVAVVQTPEGEEKHVWIEQEAVKAAGGNMDVLRDNLQSALDASPLSDIPAWVWVGGAAVAVVLVARMAAGGRHRGRFA